MFQASQAAGPDLLHESSQINEDLEKILRTRLEKFQHLSEDKSDDLSNYKEHTIKRSQYALEEPEDGLEEIEKRKQKQRKDEN